MNNPTPATAVTEEQRAERASRSGTGYTSQSKTPQELVARLRAGTPWQGDLDYAARLIEAAYPAYATREC